MAGFQDTSDNSAAGGALRIDLGALAANWRLLADTAAPAECAAVVKANAYGIGVAQAAPALAAAGCTTFFVATLDEAIKLRGILGSEATIMMFNGVLPGTAKDTHAHGIIPVLNDLGQLQEWHDLAAGAETPLAAALHTDTGMNRLGLTPGEVAELSNAPERMAGLDLKLVMSHLACGEDRDNPMNNAQLLDFNLKLSARASLCMAEIRPQEHPIRWRKWFKLKGKSSKCVTLTRPRPLAMVPPSR
jgi:alanine racemase